MNLALPIQEASHFEGNEDVQEEFDSFLRHIIGFSHPFFTGLRHTSSSIVRTAPRQTTVLHCYGLDPAP